MVDRGIFVVGRLQLCPSHKLGKPFLEGNKPSSPDKPEVLVYIALCPQLIPPQGLD